MVKVQTPGRIISSVRLLSLLFKSDRGVLSMQEERKTLSTTRSSGERSLLLLS